MYTATPGLVIGFHGCERSLRDDVINEREKLRSSLGKYEWLGHGIYFWQNNYERALDFATHPPNGRKLVNPAVLGAVISLDYCLDLLDTRHIQNLKRSFLTMENVILENGGKLPRNRNKGGAENLQDKVIRELDCLVIEYLHEKMCKDGKKPYDSVRGVFIEGTPIYEDAGFYDKTHIQLCIRNPNCIKGFFIPRQEEIW
ncbi:hypothetical protein ICL07_16810 [Chitinophaga qingshengii]|uniref:Uncharacterized protein n=2 Tax=Chitinophaga qingshengii TaxID=1569794 RepID=A0ABR7TNI4_9BACT|nr:hypothetical protein [Chitinophaga qingshengii]